MEHLNKIIDLVMEGEIEDLIEEIEEALKDNVSVTDIVEKGLQEAMNIIGPLMASGEMFIPEVLMSAETMQEGLKHLKPLLQEGEVNTLGKVVIATVEGDLHDIGKNLVAMILETSGFEVVDLGIDVSAEKIAEAAINHDADIIGLSALLTTTMPSMRETVNFLKEKNIRGKIVVGGAPISQDFANEINADGYSEDGASAVILCKKLLEVEEIA